MVPGLPWDKQVIGEASRERVPKANDLCSVRPGKLMCGTVPTLMLVGIRRVTIDTVFGCVVVSVLDSASERAILDGREHCFFVRSQSAERQVDTFQPMR